MSACVILCVTAAGCFLTPLLFAGNRVAYKQRDRVSYTRECSTSNYRRAVVDCGGHAKCCSSIQRLKNRYDQAVDWLLTNGDNATHMGLGCDSQRAWLISLTSTPCPLRRLRLLSSSPPTPPLLSCFPALMSPDVHSLGLCHLSWAMVINVQLEGEARLLSVTAIVPDPSAATAMAALGAAGGGSDQSVEAALAEGLRYW